jgi:hypothetical protein
MNLNFTAGKIYEMLQKFKKAFFPPEGKYDIITFVY